MTLPALNFPPQLLLQAQGIGVLFLDVDGVLTDGGLYFSESGETLKRFHTLDGFGLRLLQRAGIAPVVITGRDSKPLRLRLAELGVTKAHFAVSDKLPVAQSVLDDLGLDWQQAAVMGDDWPDLPLLRRCALACAPLGAQAEVAKRAHYVTKLGGGCGGVRELIDLLVVASGRYAKLLQEHLQ